MLLENFILKMLENGRAINFDILSDRRVQQNCVQILILDAAVALITIVNLLNANDRRLQQQYYFSYR